MTQIMQLYICKTSSMIQSMVYRCLAYLYFLLMANPTNSGGHPKPGKMLSHYMPSRTVNLSKTDGTGTGSVTHLMIYSFMLYQDDRSWFTDDDIPLLQFYATNYSDDEPEEFTVNPPNHVICLINWELTSVLPMLSYRL
jgi:hypothetical protein